jgi:prevent-host-death family protein
VTDVEIPVAELRANLRRYLGAVADNGGPVTITRYDQPVAVLTPALPKETDDDDR